MNHSDPLWLLSQSLNLHDTFTEGSKKIGSFIRKTEERFEAPRVIHSFLKDDSNPKQQEYILFSILDISRADFDLLEKAAGLRQLRRLVAKAQYHPGALSENEQCILGNLRQQLTFTSVNEVVQIARIVRTWIERLSRGIELETKEQTFLALLMTSEAEALKERGNWLSEHVDSYDMLAIARLLPLLTVCDEQSSSLREIGRRIEQKDRLGRAVLTLEYAMRTDSFEKWKKKVGSEPSLGTFVEMVQLQRSRLIPTRSLVAVATLSRCLHSRDASPLSWIHHALNSCTIDGFMMDIGYGQKKIKPFLEMCGITPNGSKISGDFTENSYLSWIGTDMLTRDSENETGEPSPKELVARCMANSALILRLLDNPKIFGTPGLVAGIAYTSRSIAVLQKIAQTKILYTGHANSGVPLALLKNPAHIPITLLRQFINNRFLSLTDMKSIINNPYGIRREVLNEIKDFYTRRYR